MLVDSHHGEDRLLLVQNRNHTAISPPAILGVRNEDGILRPRRTTARLVHKIKGLNSRDTSRPTTINDPNDLNQTSSLALFPAGMTCPTPSMADITALFRRVLPLLPQSVHRFYHIHFEPHLTTTTAPTPTPNSPCPNNTSSIPINQHHHQNIAPSHYKYLQTALYLPTPRAAFIHLLIAATLNHIRRTLTPQLGSYLWHVHPLDGLRLAVSNPEVFVAEMLGGVMPTMEMPEGVGVVVRVMGAGEMGRAVVRAVIAAGRVMGESLVKGGLDLAGAWAGAVLVEGCCDRKGVDGVNDSEGGMVGGKSERGKEGRRQKKGDEEVWLRVVAVGYLLWVLVTVEYVFARGMNTAAWLVACYRLLVGGRVERFALVRTLESNWAQLPLVVWQLGYYLKSGVKPLLWRSVWCAVQGRPALLLAVVGVVGSVRMLLKYRSTFYIALEVSGMFVFFGYLLIALVVLGLGLLGPPEFRLTGTTPAKAQKSNASGFLSEAGLQVRITTNEALLNTMSMPQSRKWSGGKRVSRKRVVRQ